MENFGTENGKTENGWTDAQRKKIFSEMYKARITADEMEKFLGFPMSEMTKEEASMIIDCFVGNHDLSETLDQVRKGHGKNGKIPNSGKPVGNIPPVPASEPEKKFTVEPGSELALAKTAGIPEEMANLFFMKLNGNAYLKVAGLQYMAGKKGYRRIEISDSYDEKTATWIAEARIYPKIDVKQLEALSHLSPDVQKMAYEDMSKPTNGIGTANRENVQNTKMHPFLREMAQTRALGRALRSYTGYGSTTYEELPEAEIERD